MAKPLAYFHFHEIVLSLGDALPLSWCTWCTPGWSRGLHSQTRSSQRSLSGPWSTGHSLLEPFICRICNKVPRTVCLNVILYGWNRYQLALTCTRHRRGSVAAGRCTSWSRRGRRGWTSLWSRQLTNSQTQRTLMRRNSQSWSKTYIKKETEFDIKGWSRMKWKFCDPVLVPQMERGSYPQKQIKQKTIRKQKKYKSYCGIQCWSHKWSESCIRINK